jgi:hypothetical protein
MPSEMSKSSAEASAGVRVAAAATVGDGAVTPSICAVVGEGIADGERIAVELAVAV